MLRFSNQMSTLPIQLVLLGILAVVSCLGFSSPAKAQLLPMAGILGNAGQQNYEDCILNNMKGVQSDIAAQAILDACRSKFPNANRGDGLPAQSKPGILPNQALNQLNGELLQDLGSELVFRLYNGSSDWEIHSLTLGLQYWDPTQSASIVERHTQTMATEQSFLPSQWLEIRMNNPSNSPHLLLERWWFESANGRQLPSLPTNR
ncbi:MAG: hypothetical protein CL915_12670 [Deltaproteobacteria bacterium]|nr:hypothetical protein [Deltaproteobacteria bacterium]